MIANCKNCGGPMDEQNRRCLHCGKGELEAMLGTPSYRNALTPRIVLMKQDGHLASEIVCCQKYGERTVYVHHRGMESYFEYEFDTEEERDKAHFRFMQDWKNAIQ